MTTTVPVVPAANSRPLVPGRAVPRKTTFLMTSIAALIVTQATVLDLHAAPPPPRRAPQGAWLATEKKERVPKAKPKEDTKTKGGSPQSTSTDDDDEDSGDCFLDCFFGFFSAMDAVATPVADPAAVTSAPPGWRVGDAAVVPSTAPAGTITLWSGPGGEAEGWEWAGELPANARIRVLETHSLVGGEWLLVALEDGAIGSGWVPAYAIARPPGPPPPPPKWPADRKPGTRPQSVLLVNVGPAYLVGPQEVREEYTNPLFRVGLSGNWRVAPGFSIGAVAGYGTASGDPKFDYRTSQGLDSPQSSSVHVTDFGLRIGDFVPIGKSQWFWGLGPGGYWVYESANINYEVWQLPGPVVIGSGSRTESLSRLRFGGELVTGLLWWTGGRGGNDYCGVLVRTFAIAWASKQEKSLTFDWIGDKTPVGVEIGFVYAHDWF